MIAEVSTIVARGMGVRRRGRWLLRPAAFGLTEGVIGLAGPPGVGKTTLLATFATLRRPHVGALEVLGYDTRNPADLRALRGQIGYLPTGPGCMDWAASLRVQEFVAYAAYYKQVATSAVPIIIEQMGISDAAGMVLGMLPEDLRIRAGIAAACVHRPKLVLLDEPLSGLGERHANELIPLLRTLAPTVMVTAESPAELTGWCDRIFTLSRGRLAELPGVRPHQPLQPQSPHKTVPSARHEESGVFAALAQQSAAAVERSYGGAFAWAGVPAGG